MSLTIQGGTKRTERHTSGNNCKLDLIRHGDKLGDPNFRSSQGKDQFKRKKERKKERKNSINSVHVSRNYGNKLMKTN